MSSPQLALFATADLRASAYNAPMRDHQLFDLGYAGRRAEHLAELLPADTLVIDVRLNPWSPRPEWQKQRLAVELEALGLAYLHVKGLGNLDYKSGGIRIAQPEDAQIVLDELANRDVALLCACRDVAECHRLAVTELVLALAPDVESRHL